MGNNPRRHVALALLLIIAASCASAGGHAAKRAAARGGYTFQGRVTGAGMVNGKMRVDDDGRVADLYGSCQGPENPPPMPSTVACSVRALKLILDDNGVPRRAAVDINVTTITPNNTSQPTQRVQQIRGYVEIAP
jgi:hypothetical protein